jgi:hypothetical protein
VIWIHQKDEQQVRASLPNCSWELAIIPEYTV